MPALEELSVLELSQLLAQKKLSSVELTQHMLGRIVELDPRYNSFITVSSEQALQQAERADIMRAEGDVAPLCGIPIAHKDIFCSKGIATSCGSKMLENFVSPYDATVVARLASVGAVMLGKTNMDEFAMGSSTETSYFGATRNPWDTSTVPGGSSGGSCAAVAARFCPLASGTDTGGSIRQPAALCGVTGFKPTYGRVSRFGMIAFASSLDQGGVIARHALDVALMLQVIAGQDSHDATSLPHTVPNYTEALQNSALKPLKGMTVGLPEEYFVDLNAPMQHILDAAISELQSLGAELQSVSLPHTDQAVPVYYVIAPAECSSNLARYDGIRYGHRCSDPTSLTDLITRSREEGFGEEVKRRIMVGSYVLSAGYYDAYYKQAMCVRRLIRDDFVTAFKQVDLLVAPAAPGTAFTLGALAEDPIAMYHQDVFTIPASLAGLPALSMPAGILNNMPVGLQLIGNFLDEARLLVVANAFQQATDWHLKRPPTS